MAKFSVDTKLKDLVKSPEATAILEAYVKGLTTSPQTRMAYAFTFRKIAAFPQVNLPKELVEEIDQKLQALG
jgi:hypothetical protein